jgi:hypothetical protein
MTRLILAMATLLLLWPSVAFADSDGYYCVGRGYVAFETRSAASGPQHVLHILRFSPAGGIGQVQNIPLDDFQTHGMSCGDRVIEVAAFSTRYLVDVSVPEQPRITTDSAAFEPQRTPQLNLGHWSREGVTDLEADGQRGEFQLVISRVSRRVAGGIEHYTVTQLVRREARPGGRMLASQKLFEGIFLETGNAAQRLPDRSLGR